MKSNTKTQYVPPVLAKVTRGKQGIRCEYKDGHVAEVVPSALGVRASGIARIKVDEFGGGFTVTYEDGTTDEIAGDFVLEVEAGRASLKDADDLAARVGAKVREVRAERGVSQAELARRIGIIPQNLARLEMGRHVPSLDVLLKIARALEVSMDRLVRATPVRGAKAAASRGS